MPCYHPITLRGIGQVPCGHCAACLSHKRDEWTFRLRQEMLHSRDNCYFVTLTYDNDHVPFSEDLGYMFNKDEVQRFLKRLRKSNEKTVIDEETGQIKSGSFRYYLTCEYGSATARPHYHALLFGVAADLPTFRQRLESAWNRGRTQAVTMSDATIHYVTKYCLKDLDHGNDFPKGDPRRPFTLISNRPGIGRDYLDDHSADFHYNDGDIRLYTLRPGNVKGVLPRYFRDKLFDQEFKTSPEWLKLVDKCSKHRGVLGEQIESHKCTVNGLLLEDYSLDEKAERQYKFFNSLKSKF